MRTCPVVLLLFLTGAAVAQDKSLDEALKKYNDGVAAEVKALVAAFERAEKAVKELDPVNTSPNEKKRSIEHIHADRDRFLEDGRLPEFANLILDRMKYHQRVYALQRGLLRTYDRLLAEGEKQGDPNKERLKAARERLASEMPTAEAFRVRSKWKGYRYNLVSRRVYYEMTVQTRDAQRATCVLTQGDDEWLVEGKLDGALVEFSVIKTLKGSPTKQKLQGINLGDRMLLEVTSEGKHPLLLYLQ